MAAAAGGSDGRLALRAPQLGPLAQWRPALHEPNVLLNNGILAQMRVEKYFFLHMSVREAFTSPSTAFRRPPGTASVF